MFTYPIDILNKWTFIILSVLAALSPLCYCGKVLDLGDKLPELLDKYPDKNWLVKFYAPWCHHCQQLEPTYNNVAESIYNKHDNLIVGRVDCTKYGKICEEYKIDSYPTIIFVSPNNRVKYTGDRREESMIKFAERLNGPGINIVQDCDQLNSAITKNKLIILSTISKNQKLEEAFESIARSQKANYWFYKFNSKLPKDCGKGILIEEENLYIVKKNLNRAVQFDLNYKESDHDVGQFEERILQWIRKESFPVYAQVTSGNIERALATGKLLVLAILDEYKPARKLSTSSLAFQRFFEDLAVDFVQNKQDDGIQFGWSSDHDLIEYITLSYVKAKPNVMFLNQNLSYYLILKELTNQENETNEELNEHTIKSMISKAKAGELNLSGGNTYVQLLLRYTIGNVNKFLSMYRANPMLVSLIFGFPGLIIMFVIYTTCFYDDDDDKDGERSREQRYSDDETDQEEEERPLINGHLKQD